MAISPALLANSNTTRLTILHTNDVHSRIEPFPDDGRTWGGLAGAARRATLIKKIRQEQENVLLLDAGDIWQGTPYFNFFEGSLEYKLMNEMGYDAATLGNHDFDLGLEGLEKQLPLAKFSFLTANYDFSRTQLAGSFQPYKIFQKGPIKVGVFGVGIELRGLVQDRQFKETKYLDPVAVSNEMAQQLRSEGCHLVICLSHLGLEYESNKISDTRLAAQTKGIDLIIGGHTHSFLNEPRQVRNADNEITLINQVGWSGINLGRLNYEFNAGGKVMGVTSQSMPIGPGYC
jgi:5'-nucleotidase